MSNVNAYVLRVTSDLFSGRPYAYVNQTPNFAIQIAGVKSPGNSVFPIEYDDTGSASVMIINPPYAPNLDNLDGKAQLEPMAGYAGMFTMHPCNTDRADVNIAKQRLTSLPIPQYTLDFNAAASDVLMDASCEGHCFSIMRHGTNLVLQASYVRVNGGTNFLAHKGNDTFSATISPRHFEQTGFDPGYRYRLERIEEQRFMLERFERVSYYKERRIHHFPVVTASYIRPKN